MTLVSKIWSGSEALNTADLNQNFSDLSDYVQSLTNADISQDAGITSDKLLDRYAPTFISRTLLPPWGNSTSWATALSSATEVNAPTQTAQGLATEIGKIIVPVPTGKRAFLCSVAFRTVAASTGAPRLWITQAGSVLGGSGGADLVTDTWNHLRNTSPFAAPLTALSHDDELAFYIGYDGTASTTFQGVEVVLGLKYELTN